jgi:hypothetical protein
MKATFTDHLPSGKTVEYTSVPLPVWNTQGNPIASAQYVVDGTRITRTGLHSDEGKLQDFIVNLMNVHFCGMVLDVPSECPIKKLYTSSDLKFLLDWYAAQLAKNSDEINALFIRVQELERKSFSSSDGYYYITPKDTSMISFVTGTNLVLSTIKNKFDVGGSGDDLVFTSKNPELFTVENGNLVKKGTGIGVLEAASKKNSSLKTTVKVLSIRPEDIDIEGVDGLQNGQIHGTTAPVDFNLDTNTGGDFTQSVLTIATAKDHKNDVDEIKKSLTVTETYNVDNSNGTYRLNDQGKLEKTGNEGSGSVTKTVTVKYGQEVVRTAEVYTNVTVERTHRTLELKKPVLFIEQSSLEYNVQDVLDVKNNGRSESLSGYVVKSGSPFRIEGNKLKYTGTFGDTATLTLVKDGTEVSTTIKTYKLPTFSTIDDNVTMGDHVIKKITVPNPTGPIMSLFGITTNTEFVQPNADFTMNVNGNTASIASSKANTGVFRITQTVRYNGTIIARKEFNVTVTVTSGEQEAHRTIVIKKPIIFVENNDLEYDLSDVIDIQRNGTSESLSGYTVKPGSPFVINNGKLKFTGSFGSNSTLTLVKNGTEVSTTIKTYKLPTFDKAEDKKNIVGSVTRYVAARVRGELINDYFKPEMDDEDAYPVTIEYTYTKVSGDFKANQGEYDIQLTSDVPSTGIVKYTQLVKVNDNTIATNEGSFNVTFTSKEVYELSSPTSDVVLYNNVIKSVGILGITSTKNGQPVMPTMNVTIMDHTDPTDSEGSTPTPTPTPVPGTTPEPGVVRSHYVTVNCTKNAENTYDLRITAADGLRPGETARGYVELTNGNKNLAIQFELKEFVTGLHAVPTEVTMNKAQRSAYFDVFVDGVPSEYGYSYCHSDYDITYNDQNGNWNITGSPDGEMEERGYHRIRVEQRNDVQNTGIDVVVRSRHDSSKTITVPVRYLAGQSTGGATPTPTIDPNRPVTSTSAVERKHFNVGNAVKLSAPEFSDATYTWHLPDGSTRTGREIEFTAAQQYAGKYTVDVTFPDPYRIHTHFIIVNIISLQETAVSEADKEIRTGDSVDFTAPPAIGMIYTAPDKTIEAEEDDLEYQWQITTTPDVEDSWKDIEGADTQNLKYVASKPGVYYIRRTTQFSEVRAIGGKTKLTVTAAVDSQPEIIGTSNAEEQALVGETVKLTAREYPGATYTWTLPDGSTRTGREIEFIAAVDKAGEYRALITLSNRTEAYLVKYNVNVYSLEDTAVSEADKEIHVGDSIEFTAPASVSAAYDSTGHEQIDEDEFEYKWEITSTPDVDSSWTSITGGDKQNLTYTASQEGVYYIRRTTELGELKAFGGKTKVTVKATGSTSTPKRISNVTVNVHNLVNIQAGTPTTVSYTVNYTGELEDGNTNDLNIIPNNAETSYAIGNNNSVTIDDIYITVDKTNKTITFETSRKLGAKEVELEVLSNSNVVGMFTVSVTPQSTPTPKPVDGGYDEHGVHINPNSDGTPTPTSTPTPTTPVADGSSTPTPTLEPVVTPRPVL